MDFLKKLDSGAYDKRFSTSWSGKADALEEIKSDMIEAAGLDDHPFAERAYQLAYEKNAFLGLEASYYYLVELAKILPTKEAINGSRT